MLRYQVLVGLVLSSVICASNVVLRTKSGGSRLSMQNRLGGAEGAGQRGPTLGRHVPRARVVLAFRLVLTSLAYSSSTDGGDLGTVHDRHPATGRRGATAAPALRI